MNEMNELNGNESNNKEEILISDYMKVCEYILEDVKRKGGYKKQLYMDRSKQEQPGIAWSYIVAYLQFLKNDQTEDTFNRILEKVHLNRKIFEQIKLNPFNICAEEYFFAIQYAVFSCYDDLSFNLTRRVAEIVAFRTTAFQLTYERKGTLQFQLIPFYIIGKTIGKVSSKYSTLSDSTSKALSKWWEKKKEFEFIFLYNKTPKRHLPYLNRPKEIEINGKKYYPNKETIYSTGVSDCFSIMCHSFSIIGLLNFKGLFINMGVRTYEYPLLPDQLGRFHDGKRYRMNAEGFFYNIDDPEGDLMVDSLGKIVTFQDRVQFAFDENKNIIYGLNEQSIKADKRVKEVITYNSERTRFIIYYDMLMPWQKLVASIALDLKERITNEHDCNVGELGYPEVKKIIKTYYKKEFWESWRKRRLGRLVISPLALALGVCTSLFLSNLPVLQMILMSLWGILLCFGISRDAYKSFIRRVERVKQEDVNEYHLRENYISEGLHQARDNSDQKAHKTFTVFNGLIEEMKLTTVSTGDILAGLQEFTKSNQSNVEAQEKLQLVIHQLVSLVDTMKTQTDSLVNNITSQVNNSFSDIYNAVEENNEQTKKLINETEKITQSQNMLNDITDQINLLSLNASIEAARAGDQGRGFAVVAEEVSKLAEKSQLSVKEINVINKNVQDGIDSVYNKNMEGVALLKRVNESVSSSLQQIQTEFQKLPDSVSDSVSTASAEIETIAASSEELTASIEEITASVDSISVNSNNTIKRIEEEKKTL
ncbi:MAG: hypothetical protein GY754_10345 [bacterium]|nr:hypothetical protein [bacterium]